LTAVVTNEGIPSAASYSSRRSCGSKTVSRSTIVPGDTGPKAAVRQVREVPTASGPSTRESRMATSDSLIVANCSPTTAQTAAGAAATGRSRCICMTPR